jgi:hypothetical protein
VNEYIFRMPRDTPELTWTGLDAYMGADRMKPVGTTVMLIRYDDPDEGALIMVRLYATTIATLYADGRVRFTVNGASDCHQATSTWLSQVAMDNKLGHIWQDKFVRYLYPRTPDIDTGRQRMPVAGQTFQSRAS